MYIYLYRILLSYIYLYYMYIICRYIYVINSNILSMGVNFLGALSLSLLLNCLQENWSLIPSMKFFSPNADQYLYKFTIWSCMEYCCHVWAGAPSCCLELLLSCKNEYAGISFIQNILHLLPLWNPCLIIEM